MRHFSRFWFIVSFELWSLNLFSQSLIANLNCRKGTFHEHCIIDYCTIAEWNVNMSIHLSYIASVVTRSFDALESELKTASHQFHSNAAYKLLSNHVTGIVNETLVINGKEFEIRRIFVHTPDSGSYEGVGWVLASDVKHCMICSSTFGYFTYQHYCVACGNIVCQKCSSNEALIFEVEHLGPMRCCDQCYWGQVRVIRIWN